MRSPCGFVFFFSSLSFSSSLCFSLSYFGGLAGAGGSFSVLQSGLVSVESGPWFPLSMRPPLLPPVAPPFPLVAAGLHSFPMPVCLPLSPLVFFFFVCFFLWSHPQWKPQVKSSTENFVFPLCSMLRLFDIVWGWESMK